MNIKEKKEAFKKYIEDPTKEDIKKMSYSLAIFKAAVKKFVTKDTSVDYVDLFKKYIYNRMSADKELFDKTYARNIKVMNDSNFNFDEQNSLSTIFASFHYGPYRTFIAYLLEKGLKVVALVDDVVYINQKDNFFNKIIPLLNTPESADFQIVNVKDRASIFKLKDFISKGYVTTVYLDGNSALDRKDQDFTKSYIVVEILKDKIFAKNGIGKLAALLGLSIIPTIANYDENENVNIKFYKEIKSSDFESKEIFSEKSIEKCYQILNNHLNEDFIPWECWGYIHKWFKRGERTPYETLGSLKNTLNINRYTFFEMSSTKFIFDLLDYESIPIDEHLYKSLINNNFEKIPLKVKKELILKNVII